MRADAKDDAMSDLDDEILLRKLKALPPDRRVEVEDFIDFLATKARKKDALERLLGAAPALEKANVAPPSEREVAAEIRETRSERAKRGTGRRADRP
jgi:hypothetical protein